MRIIVTGAGGFVGRKLVSMLSDHDVVALDWVSSGIPDLSHITPIVGDLCDRATLEAAFSKGCDAVVHLATVAGGAAEQNPDLGKHVNIDAVMLLTEIAMRFGSRPRFVFASSIAVFGDPMPVYVNDETSLAPKMLYGAHKAMMEQWLAMLARRGDLDTVSLRLSGVIARPKGPSGMKSAFLSNVFHALRNGERFEMPVSEDASSWLTSNDIAARNFAHALTVDSTALPNSFAITLPALRVRVDELVAEIAYQSEQSAALVNYSADAKIEAMFGEQPPLTHETADGLGFARDADLESLVRNALLTVQN